MPNDQTGAVIEQGPADWQILQQDEKGQAAFELRGRWVGEAGGRVQWRMVHEATADAVAPGLDWSDARTAPDGTWQARVTGIPAGGLYRLETRYNPNGNLAGEWSPRGDMRHFIGVGDLWIIAGQSNSAGYGRGPIHDPPELGVHLFRNSELWALATHPLNESTDTKHPVNREVANPAHAPYLHFGRLLQRSLNHPIGLIQTSLGGSPLSSWNPTEPGEHPLYENMLHCVALAGGRVRGVLWYQGESDAGGDKARTYRRRFAAAVRAWRKALRNPKLAVLTVQLNRFYGEPNPDADAGWVMVREAQRRIPHEVPLTAAVPTLDLTLTDGIHISSASNLLLAERLANAALGMVHGKDVAYLAPDITGVTAQRGGRVLRLEFANVTSRIQCLDGTANCYRVEDARGVIAIEKITYPTPRTIALHLERAAAVGAHVHGGWGFNPHQVPVDMERQLPMLGFSVAL